MLSELATGGKYTPVATTWSTFLLLLLEDNLFQQSLQENFRMLQVVYII